MRNLGPGILRLGGNSQDNTCWKPAAAPHADRCQGELTSADFHLYSEAAKATGWRLIVGLNLKQNSSQWALSEVTQGIARELTPQQVLGLEPGNEPDLFGEPERPKSYSIAALIKDFFAYSDTFRNNATASKYPVIGPAICCRWRNPQDLGAFLDGVGASTLKLVTVHEYARTVCDGRRVTAEELLAPELMTRFNDAARSWVAAAQQRHLPIALAETNSASCGGMPGVSNAFASTLWGLDWLFSAAEDGSHPSTSTSAIAQAAVPIIPLILMRPPPKAIKMLLSPSTTPCTCSPTALPATIFCPQVPRPGQTCVHMPPAPARTAP
jgi:hypothetical protein